LISAADIDEDYQPIQGHWLNKTFEIQIKIEDNDIYVLHRGLGRDPLHGKLRLFSDDGALMNADLIMDQSIGNANILTCSYFFKSEVLNFGMCDLLKGLKFHKFDEIRTEQTKNPFYVAPPTDILDRLPTIEGSTTHDLLSSLTPKK